MQEGKITRQNQQKEAGSPIPTPEKKEWIDWMNAKVLQKAVVVDEEGNMLALRRSEIGSASRFGMWDLPGGSMSSEDLIGQQENPHEAAIRREVEEETGLKVKDVAAIYVSSGIKKTKRAGDVLVLAIGYRCQVAGIRPQVTRSSEHIEDKWVTKEEFLGLEFGDDGGFHLRVIKQV
ncbi:MAG: NUDIX domain-containing protein [Candidatus Cloacimonetes bacterium]|nr:NUDIX domain-containing protein [Candidatus Cloacimonadota bacterium]